MCENSTTCGELAKMLKTKYWGLIKKVFEEKFTPHYKDYDIEDIAKEMLRVTSLGPVCGNLYEHILQIFFVQALRNGDFGIAEKIVDWLAMNNRKLLEWKNRTGDGIYLAPMEHRLRKKVLMEIIKEAKNTDCSQVILEDIDELICNLRNLIDFLRRVDYDDIIKLARQIKDEADNLTKKLVKITAMIIMSDNKQRIFKDLFDLAELLYFQLVNIEERLLKTRPTVEALKLFESISIARKRAFEIACLF